MHAQTLAHACNRTDSHAALWLSRWWEHPQITTGPWYEWGCYSSAEAWHASIIMYLRLLEYHDLHRQRACLIPCDPAMLCRTRRRRSSAGACTSSSTSTSWTASSGGWSRRRTRCATGSCTGTLQVRQRERQGRARDSSCDLDLRLACAHMVIFLLYHQLLEFACQVGRGVLEPDLACACAPRACTPCHSCSSLRLAAPAKLVKQRLHLCTECRQARRLCATGAVRGLWAHRGRGHELRAAHLCDHPRRAR